MQSKGETMFKRLSLWRRLQPSEFALNYGIPAVFVLAVLIIIAYWAFTPGVEVRWSGPPERTIHPK